MLRSSAPLVVRLYVSAIGFLAAIMSLAAFAPSVHAQGAGAVPPPEHITIDDRGVDLITGRPNLSVTEVVIGQPGQGGLAYTRMIRDGVWYHNFVGTVNVSGNTYTVSMDGVSDVFDLTGSVFVSRTGRGATLTRNASNIFTYTGADGTVATFHPMPVDIAVWAANAGRLTELRQPNGLTLTFSYHIITVRAPCPLPDGCPARALRLNSVTSNAGYRIVFTYKALNATTTGNISPWLHEDTVTGFNLTVDNCAGGPCTFTRTWPSVTYSDSAFAWGQTVTDQSGRVTTYSGPWPLSITPPGAAAPAITYTGSPITSVTQAGSTWTYAYGGTAPTRTAQPPSPRPAWPPTD